MQNHRYSWVLAGASSLSIACGGDTIVGVSDNGGGSAGASQASPDAGDNGGSRPAGGGRGRGGGAATSAPGGDRPRPPPPDRGATPRGGRSNTQLSCPG